jgi:hypothetical protein
LPVCNCIEISTILSWPRVKIYYKKWAGSQLTDYITTVQKGSPPGLMHWVLTGQTGVLEAVYPLEIDFKTFWGSMSGLPS